MGVKGVEGKEEWLLAEKDAVVAVVSDPMDLRKLVSIVLMLLFFFVTYKCFTSILII